MYRSILTTLAAIALLGATSTAAFAQQDLRMPDTRDAAAATTQQQDLRSPDAQDAARADEIAAQLKTYAEQPQPPIRVSVPAPVASDDTPWPAIAGSIVVAFALGAGAAGGLMYLRRTRPSTLARS